MRLPGKLGPPRDKLRQADRDQHLAEVERQRQANMAALQARCAAVGCTVEEASQASTIGGQTVDAWLIDREAQLGLLEPDSAAPRWAPPCAGMLRPGLYALSPTACCAVRDWANREGQQRGCVINFAEAELAEAAGIAGGGGKLFDALAGRCPISEAEVVRLARTLGVDARSIVWRRPSGLREL